MNHPDATTAVPDTTTAPTMTRRKLPIGIQNLREIREEGFYYVDKSGLAVRNYSKAWRRNRAGIGASSIR